MNRTLKRKIIALGLSFSMASSALSSEGILSNTAIVSAAKSSNTYKVNSYGVLTSYSGNSNVHIRTNVSALTTTVFDNTKVTSFSVNSNNKYFKSVDGVLYTKNGKKLVRFPSGRKGSFVVPDTVTTISQDAFRNSSLTSIQIPDSVNAIGNSAFYNSKKLQTINIPSKVTALRKNMFYHCRSLTTVTLPSKLEVLGSSAFEGCRSLTSISLPDSLERAGHRIFFNCKSLTKISISDNMKNIPVSTFQRCSSLTEVKFGKNVEEIGYASFADCSSLKSITIPGNVDIIGTAAFSDCTNLQNITLKNGLSYIYNHAFANCSSLKNITIPNSVKELNSCAFLNCSNLEKATLSDQISTLQFATFENCSKLRSIHLPESLTRIEKHVFSNCTSLTTLKIPANVSYIQNNAFDNAVSDFVVDKDNTNFSSEDGILYNENQTKLLKFPSFKSGNYTTPDSVTRISNTAFYTCHKIKNVTIGEGVKKLYKFCLDDSSIETLSLPSSLKVLDGQTARIDTPKLENISISSKNKNFTSENGILYTKDKKILCLYPSAQTGTITFPKEAAELNAISPENKASKFAVASGSAVYATDDGMLTNLEKNKIYAAPAAKTSYHMGSKMRNIDVLSYEKYALKKLKAITVSEKNPKYSAKNGVLLNKYQTRIIFYPNAREGAYTTPSSVSEIKENAFSYASQLTDITLGKNISKCSLSLTDCSALKTVTLKEGSLRSLYLSPAGTTHLKKVTLPSSLLKARIYCSKEAAKDLSIAGWTNTTAERLAQRLGAKFISVGLVPKQLKNTKLKAYVNLKMLKISWKRDPQVNGYEIYSDSQTLKTIKDNKITEASIYVGDKFYSELYVRSYKIQKGKKIYGKAKKLKYYPYSV